MKTRITKPEIEARLEKLYLASASPVISKSEKRRLDAAITNLESLLVREASIALVKQLAKRPPGLIPLKSGLLVKCIVKKGAFVTLINGDKRVDIHKSRLALFVNM